MPHATESIGAQDVQDDLLIRQVLDPENTNFDISRELEPGEKADDAVDYGDLSDDDLADDDDLSRMSLPEPGQPGPIHEGLEDMLTEDQSQVTNGNGAYEDEFDDLFGDTPPPPINKADIALEESVTSPLPHLESFESGQTDTQDGYQQKAVGRLPVQLQKAENIQPRSLQALDTQTVSKEEQMQQYLISMSRHGAAAQEGPLDETRDEYRTQDLATLWPKFERHRVPRFMDLLPGKRSYYVGKKPTKQPKPIYPTKLNLDLAHDQEKHFRLASSPRKHLDADGMSNGVVRLSPVIHLEADRADDAPLLSDSDTDVVGGVTWQDLQIVCEDWDNQSHPESTVSDFSPLNERPGNQGDDDGDYFATGETSWALPPAKVSRRCVSTPYLLT